MAIDDGLSASIRDAILDFVLSSTFLEKSDAAICPGSKDQDWRFIWTRKLTQMVFANALALNYKMQITDHLDRATYIRGCRIGNIIEILHREYLDDI